MRSPCNFRKSPFHLIISATPAWYLDILCMGLSGREWTGNACEERARTYVVPVPGELRVHRSQRKKRLYGLRYCCKESCWMDVLCSPSTHCMLAPLLTASWGALLLWPHRFQHVSLPVCHSWYRYSTGSPGTTPDRYEQCRRHSTTSHNS